MNEQNTNTVMIPREEYNILLMSQARLDDIRLIAASDDLTYYDLFRVENGKIAEHWDVMETIADKETWANDNGKF